MRKASLSGAFRQETRAMSSMARMAVFVVMGSALTVGALMLASYLSG
jgi:hypothetical protein